MVMPTLSIEKLWKKVKEDGTHLHYFPTFESLINKVNEALLIFENASDEVLSICGFYREIEKELDKKLEKEFDEEEAA